MGLGVLSDGALVQHMTETVEVPKAKLDQLEKLAPLADLADELGGVGELIEGIRRGLEFGDFRPKAAQDIAELKKKVGSDDDDGDDETDKTPAETAETTPQSQLERMAGLPGHVAEESLAANEERAHHLLQNIMEYSQSTPKGRVLMSGDMMRILTSKEGTMYYETVRRVMDCLKEWGEEIGVKRVRGESREWRIVIPKAAAGRIHRLTNSVVSPPE